jgi:hypothetical protein
MRSIWLAPILSEPNTPFSDLNHMAIQKRRFQTPFSVCFRARHGPPLEWRGRARRAGEGGVDILAHTFPSTGPDHLRPGAYRVTLRAEDFQTSLCR